VSSSLPEASASGLPDASSLDAGGDAAPDAEPDAQAPWVSLATGSCPKGMAGLPGGTFKTGGSGYPTVTMRSFCMDLTEVTADDYAACVRAGDCNDEHLGDAPGVCTYGQPGKGNHPVNCVDYYQATDYCASKCKRLPTQEEFQWAARGGPRATAFPWGNDEPDPDHGCFVGCEDPRHRGTPLGHLAHGCSNPRETCAVGSFPKGDAPSGIHDLSGNVDEWTTSIGHEGTIVLAGGHWESEGYDVAAGSTANGGTVNPFKRETGDYSEHTGFRCVSRVHPGPDDPECGSPYPRWEKKAGPRDAATPAVDAAVTAPVRDR
jgi:formylglycine-generating enzyme required for sulfatase activity